MASPGRFKLAMTGTKTIRYRRDFLADRLSRTQSPSLPDKPCRQTMSAPQEALSPALSYRPTRFHPIESKTRPLRRYHRASSVRPQRHFGQRVAGKTESVIRSWLSRFQRTANVTCRSNLTTAEIHCELLASNPRTLHSLR